MKISRTSLYMMMFVFSISFFACHSGLKKENTFLAKESVPVTDSEFKNNPDHFQFAIVSDRGGNIRKGIFKSAITKINTLQPEFVMSVGDLIEGLTEDTALIHQEWEEFESIINPLEMPFFYVPGNHDFSNATMDKIWKERIGESYYHFIYKDVLFLCLNTEDQYKIKTGTISAPQYEYIKEVLESNKTPRWTFVFLHQPMWMQKTAPQWDAVAELLKDRPHTVFAGHKHKYTKYERQDNNYYVLASTGGVSPLRGPSLGEFDHITWVTMGADKPIISNLLLDGIIEEDINLEANNSYVDSVIGKTFLEFTPLFEDDFSEEKDLAILIRNPLDVPMSIELKSKFGWDLVGTFSVDTLRIPAKGEAVEILNIRKRNKKNFKIERPLEIKAYISFDFPEVRHIKMPLTYFILPEPKYPITKVNQPKQIDGQLDDWKALPFETSRANPEDSLDNHLRFNLTYDEQFLYFGAQVTDDQIMVDTVLKVWEQDCISLILNAQDLKTSSSRRIWYDRELLVRASPETSTFSSTIYQEHKIPDGVQKVCKQSPGGFQMEVAIPLKHLEEYQGKDWQHLRLNILIEDYDQTDPKGRRLWFMPDWYKSNNRVGSGMFFKE